MFYILVFGASEAPFFHGFENQLPTKILTVAYKDFKAISHFYRLKLPKRQVDSRFFDIFLKIELHYTDFNSCLQRF